MPVTPDLLQSLIQTLRPQAQASNKVSAGQLMQVHLLPAPTDLTVADTITRTLELLGIGKNVQFQAPGVVPKPLAQNLKLIEQAASGICNLPVIKQICDALRPTGIGGLLAQLNATYQVPSESSAALSVEVEWIVKDSDNSTVLSTDEWKIRSGGALPEMSFHIAPYVREWTSPPDLTPLQRYLHARVKLTALGVTSGWLDVPGNGLLILVEPLLVPRMLVGGLHKNFAASSGNDEGASLVVLPTNSPFTAWAQVMGTINNVRNSIAALSDLPKFASAMTGLPNILASLNAIPHIVPVVEDQIPYLNDIDLITRGFFENDTEAEDELSSILLVGPPGSYAQLYNAQNYGNGEGQLTLTVGEELFATIPDLHSANPSAGVGTVARVTPPAGFNPLPPHNITQFGDELSSLQIRPAP
jgi:hypothetical protein